MCCGVGGEKSDWREGAVVSLNGREYFRIYLRVRRDRERARGSGYEQHELQHSRSQRHNQGQHNVDKITS